ncbi:WhiB family transcriptional regulator [Corynebacterium sp.]|uniref:WhiB family transcriptional regulator n=1 Tax=Corynebacterium sp. TaxID=1720 RepID=UPI002A9094FF|nr:WhiB family transcriptional regulator [Corynebacterium sp.]MDY5785855.1 WhiB family transcriptional regulator [Corynebacterium sp.]
MRPACSYRDRELFTAPAGPGDPSTERAKSICEACPIRVECAKRALTAGASLDGSVVAPAVDVIQAGVYCDGSERATWELAAVAGVTPPEPQAKAKRATIPDHCVSCGEPMVQWNRGVTPEGFVEHYARGYCQQCRSAYRKAYPPGSGGSRGLRKRVDRKNHSAPARKNAEVVVQFALFDREAACG